MSEMLMKVARALSEADWSCDGDYRALAHAAIEAMREPTEEMISAANRNNHPRDIETWQTMIDVALS